jgi:hypothetical protein
MQEQAELIGGGFAAGCAVGGEMGLPGFDVIFRSAAPAINVFVKSLRPAACEITEAHLYPRFFFRVAGLPFLPRLR